MLSFKDYLKEEDEGSKLKHIHHAEDRPLLHGHAGFEHAHAALMAAHEHMKSGAKSNKLTMKYDGSPSVVFGHHPHNGKFFVASKSAFNKNPKINHTHEDIEKNHGHAPGLAEKLHAALDHLPKVTPKKGVYQGDIMHTHGDLKESKVSFTPNTITYTAHGKEADKIKKSKIGVVVHQQYHGDDLSTMKATPHTDHKTSFKEHPDVFHHGADHDTSKINYSHHDQEEFHHHMAAAKHIHDTYGKKMYAATAKHQGDGGHLTTYINHTVRTGEAPTSEGLKKHIREKYNKLIDKAKSEKGKKAKESEANEHINHIEKHKEHYDHLFTMHHHLQKAKDTLVRNLEQHEGDYEHHIDHTKSKPEGFVISHEDKPTKLVNRKEFARQNLLKVKAWKK